MKIAFLNISQGAVYRGAETFVEELSQRLVEKGHRVETITDRKNYASRWPFFWRFFIDPQGLQILGFTLKNLSKIWRGRFDVVIPLNGGWQPAFVRVLTWLYGGKMVISGQSGVGWDDRNNLWSFPDIFVSTSSLAARWAKKVNPFIKVKYIPNGVDIKKFKNSNKPIEVDLPRPIVLTVAALDSSKRIDLVIRAVSILPKASLLVAGKGPGEENLRKLGKKLLLDRFKIISLPYEKMASVYASADLFTYAPVPWESFGIVLVEAMASGLPVVVTDDPIRREIVGDAGLFVDPADTDAYSKALDRALKTNWADMPRKQAEKFDWDKIAKQYESLFRELVLSE